jgi:acetyl esterase/lipase
MNEDAIDPDLDPELLPLLAGFPDIPLDAGTLPGFRAAIAGMSALPDPASHPDVTIEPVRVPGPAGAPPVRCLLYRPVRPTLAALLHIHGGGFVMGLPEMDAARNLMLAAELRCTILSVDYRLAPEHPHPAALEDCHAALVWLAHSLPAARVGVIGESAGAGLGHWLSLLARDRGSVALACAALVYPMVVRPGAEVAATAQDTRIGRHVWPSASNAFGWASLLGSGPLAGVSDDLSRLPPALVAAAELDLFVHDNLDFASRLMRAGNRVEAHCYSGAFHGFDRMADAAVARRFTRDLLDFLRRHLAPQFGPGISARD